MNRDGSTIAASRRTEFRSTSPNPLAATNRGRGAGCHGNFPPGFQLGGEIFLLTFPSIEQLTVALDASGKRFPNRWSRCTSALRIAWPSKFANPVGGGRFAASFCRRDGWEPGFPAADCESGSLRSRYFHAKPTGNGPGSGIDCSHRGTCRGPRRWQPRGPEGRIYLHLLHGPGSGF